jgi:hypothetical protein
MDTARSRHPARRRLDASADALLATLDADTDLAHLVKRVCAHDMPRAVVSVAALTAWQRRDPEGWARVVAWLTALGVAIVRA